MVGSVAEALGNSICEHSQDDQPPPSDTGRMYIIVKHGGGGGFEPKNKDYKHP